MELSYTKDRDYDVEMEFISEITAVFTTANARLRLYQMLDWLHPSQVIYCDTDSVIFLHDPDNPEHKSPETPPEQLPKGLRFGDALGEWSNELGEGEHIEEIVCGGAKSYAYRTNKGKVVLRQKGITLDRANAGAFTFENFKEMVLRDLRLKSDARHQFVWNEKTKDIETRFISREVRATIDSNRATVGKYETLPSGWV